MDGRLRGLEITRAPTTATQPAAPSGPSTLTSTRPLSDIRELTEPSLIDILARRSNVPPRLQPSLLHSNSVNRTASLQPNAPVRVVGGVAPNHHRAYAKIPTASSSSSLYSTTPDRSSFYAIPHSSVPRRSSSQAHSQGPLSSHARKSSIRVVPPAPPLPANGGIIPDRGTGRSPVKEVGLRTNPVTGHVARRRPSRTHVRHPPPVDILESPECPHHRVKVELQVTAPLFVGGGTIEGSVRVTIDGNKNARHREVLRICSLSIDLLGYEELGARHATFLALGTELIDAKHPPPINMIESNSRLAPGDTSWRLTSSVSMLPFVLSLPLDTGPAPFQSAKASIAFLLTATAFVRVDQTPYRPVRSSQEVQILPTYDPEKALTSLPSPLTASDELCLPRTNGRERVRITAGLHRQVWVSGSSIFVDIHVSNKSRKIVRRLDLELERNILLYKHAAATTGEVHADQARIFEDNHRSLVTISTLRSGSPSWSGVEAHASETRTYHLELPRGHASVRCGKYFEVRFFLNIIATISNTKVVSVQLPIILIHMNSLDVVPNVVAQVAAAIEEKRTAYRRRNSERRFDSRAPSRKRSHSSPAQAMNLHRKPSYSQGRAFTAAREQPLNLHRAEQAELHDLSHAISVSPRKYAARLHGITIKKTDNGMSFGDVLLGDHTFHTPPRPTFRGMLYSTPSTTTPESHNYSSSSSHRSGTLRDGLRAMRSLDTLHIHSRHTPPTPPRLPSPSQILGLRAATNSAPQPPHRPAYERPPTAASTREKLDRSRFEFKAVRRKVSGTWKERGLGWWEGLRFRDRERDRDGWI